MYYVLIFCIKYISFVQKFPTQNRFLTVGFEEELWILLYTPNILNVSVIIIYDQLIHLRDYGMFPLIWSRRNRLEKYLFSNVKMITSEADRIQSIHT